MLPKLGTATQSSMSGDRPAENAVDGYYKQKASFCSHTAVTPGQGWWKFIFDYDFLLEYVVIYRRSGDGFNNRMRDADVEVFDGSESSYENCGNLGVISSSILRVDCGRLIEGRGVRVIHHNTAGDSITICEIDFFGKILS